MSSADEIKQDSVETPKAKPRVALAVAYAAIIGGVGSILGGFYAGAADAERARIHETAKGMGFRNGYESASECIENEVATGKTVTDSVGICRKKLLTTLSN